MDWNTIKAVTVVSSVLGAVLIAAAKSIFASKTDCEKMYKKAEDGVNTLNSKLYGEQGTLVYVTRLEWEKSKHERERQTEKLQQHLFNKIDKLTEILERLRDSQEQTNLSISRLQVRRVGDERT